LRSSRHSLRVFVAISAALVASDFAFAAFPNDFWRVAVCVLLVVAVSMIVLILRSLQREREAAENFQGKIAKREAELQAREGRLLRALVTTAGSRRNPNGRD
jgi:uncharacterized membrane protein